MKNAAFRPAISTGDRADNKEYMAKKRCSLAAELLLDTHVSVQEIASYVGYQDNNYFSKVFKNERGVSPLEYRNNHKNIKNSIF